MPQIKGPFEVKRTSEPPYDEHDGVVLGRSHFDKQFHGGLEATGSVEMIAAGTPVKGSAAYVAIERVVGTVDGKQGTFILMHSATMNRGQPALAVAVVPDSATGELTGLRGTMNIEIQPGGAHFYTFDYEIAPS